MSQLRPATHVSLRHFQAQSAPQSFYLGNIYQQVPRNDVANLLGDLGCPPIMLYWHDKVNVGNQHQGWCWVEYESPEKAMQAWRTLEGRLFANRILRVSSVSKPNALQRPPPDVEASSRSTPVLPVPEPAS